MNKLIVIVGSGSVGKTTYAKKLCEKYKYKLLSIDEMFSYAKKEKGYKEFLDRISEILNSEKDTSFVLDGHVIAYDKKLEYLKSKLQFHKVETVVLFESPEEIVKRKGIKKRLEENIQVIRNIYIIGVPLFLNINECKFVRTKEYQEVSFGEYQGIIAGVSKREIMSFLDDLKKMTYDKTYQDIEFPYNIYYNGYSNSKESWERIKGITDYYRKEVLDIGTFHGYFAFKVRESGSHYVLGLDKSGIVLETTERIKGLKGIDKVEFKVQDMDKHSVVKTFDITLLLNTFHHFKERERIIQNVLEHTKELVAEININDDKPIIKRNAEKQGFKLVEEKVSHRPGRVINLYRKQN